MKRIRRKYQRTFRGALRHAACQKAYVSRQKQKVMDQGSPMPGRKHRAIDRLRHVSPASHDLLKQAAERGHQLGRLTQQLMQLLNLYGPAELEAAIQEALLAGSPHAAAVQQSLEHRRHQRGLPPPVALDFGSTKANEIVVVPKSLDVYDSLLKSEEEQP